MPVDNRAEPKNEHSTLALYPADDEEEGEEPDLVTASSGDEDEVGKPMNGRSSNRRQKKSIHEILADLFKELVYSLCKYDKMKSSVTTH